MESTVVLLHNEWCLLYQESIVVPESSKESSDCDPESLKRRQFLLHPSVHTS